MPVIFISYRREDSAGHAGRLFDRLREHFGRDNVFLDVAGIDAGVDFVDTLDKAVGSCDVLLAVIGREWLACCDKQGRRRLDDPNDFIRAEISVALKRDVRVVPVLVEGAEMPPTDALPEELKRLTRRQAVELRDSRWDADVEALIATLEKRATRPGTAPLQPAAPPAVRTEPAKQEEGRRPDRRGLLWGIGALAAVLVAVGLALWSPWSPVEPDRPPDGPINASGPPKEPEPTPAGEGQVEPTPAGGGQVGEPGEETPPEPRRVNAPNLVGLSLDEARERLRSAGLAVGEEAKQTSDAPAQRVLSQWPRPGKELDPGTEVDLVYAVPPPDPRVEIPNVVGMDVRQAMDTLRNAGLEVARRSEPSPETQNQVIRQEPAAGSRVEKGTRVTVFYATAAAVRTTTVFIHYADEANRTTAEGLARYLRGLKLEGVDYKVLLSRRGLETGKLFYPSQEQADLARTIASRSAHWLSRTYDLKVRITTELDPNTSKTALVLAMPGPK